MTNINEVYLSACLNDNDLHIMGVFDPIQGYGILHKWGNKKDVNKLLNMMKNTAKKIGLNEDVYCVYSYPEFTIEQLRNMLEEPSAWYDFCVSKEGI